ncbi:13426_t:CDS:2 [Ambispora gerdemannii]|uniref:Nitrate reductase [NADPH] n=1 Tax=Ambispora gerdemannii TaxID=144530 RepID=A0A9N9A7W6_9GLOM|nr:13426_t:CDS:2 [Ambispora gerdemannii]
MTNGINVLTQGIPIKNKINEEKSTTPIKVNAIDPRDVGTPDDWIPRHQSLVRLTGKHPFNCEPPLSMLMEQGFITPNPLHYVRNHGPAAKLSWETHRLAVEGLVSKQLSLTMDEIVRLPSREIPVTLVCAGNRRKEQNMIKQSIGFNWGAAAVSTAVWKGVPLRHVLKMAGVSLDEDEPRYVWFHGCDKLPKGYYGTSISLDWSMNDANDVLLAYEMNGERLAPDHGFPLRVIIPGFIGGRMIKWLTKITVLDKESDSHYHYHDNRVLPPHVDNELANKEKWWYKPDYIINELNINSAITSPAHDEQIPFSSFVSTSCYTLKGYAYSGGGRKVTRVEVSIDNGKTWTLTELTYPELTHPLVMARKNKPLRRHWCWIFWELPVPILSLIRCSEIMVRAWDASQNTQPQDPTWNVMGMMNNCYFRVKVHTVTQGKEFALTFEHPTQPGNIPGGWMYRNNMKQAISEAPSVAAKSKVADNNSSSSNKNSKTYTMAQVAKHDNENDCWIVIDNKVYDCTKFLALHPGGADSITINAGTDCSDEFNAIHSPKARKMLEEYYIGDFDESPSAPVLSKPAPAPALISQPTPTIQSENLVALNPKVWLSCRLISKKILSKDTRIFRFSLPSEKHQLGLPPGNHIFLRAVIEEKSIIRAYTPITCSGDPPGYFDLLIKVYFKNVHPRFPNGGFMTQHMESLAIGEDIEVKGPLGSIVYLGRGQYQVKSGVTTHKRSCSKIGLIAGGSGITPVYQVIKTVVDDPEDTTELSLIYANQTEQDILLREELDSLASKHPNFKVWYTVDRPPKDWKYSSGFINEELLREHLPGPLPKEQTITLMCGPPPMLDYACIPNLVKMGFSEREYFKF